MAQFEVLTKEFRDLKNESDGIAVQCLSSGSLYFCYSSSEAENEFSFCRVLKFSSEI